MNSKKNPFKNLALEPEEAEINRAIETGKAKLKKLSAAERRHLQAAGKS